MSTFQILHISDLHIKPKENFDRSVVLDPLIERLKEDIKSGFSPEIVIVTGDIAYSGKKPEYKIAKTFFDDFLKNLKLSNDRLFIVPGNHDVDFDEYRPNDAPSYENMAELNTDLEKKKYRKDLLKGLEEYFTFIKTHYSHLKSMHDHLIPFVHSYEAKCGKKIGLVGLNSAWMCRRYHYDKKLPYKEKIAFEMIAIGEYQIKLAMEELQRKCKHDLFINVFHHPLSWLWQIDREICKAYFDGNIVLTGHLHHSESEYVRSSNSIIYQFMAGAAYEGSEYHNRFQYITFDWGKNNIIVDYRKFDKDKRIWCVEGEMGKDGVATFDMIDSVKKIGEKLKTITIYKNFETYLHAALNEHRHLPTQGFETTLRIPIELERVYVNMHAHIHFQDFGLTPEGKIRTHDKIREEKLSSLDIKGAFEASDRHKVKDMLILGDPGSGKTTLLKYMLIMLIQGKGLEKFGIKQKLIPFLAPLRELNLKNPDREKFYDFLTRVCCLKDFSIPDVSFKKLLQNGQAIVLLDGLDEVANEEMRFKTCRWIDKARKVLPYTRFVITSRFAGYQGRSRLEGSIFELSIQDFTIDEVQEFLVRWFESVETALHHGGDEERCRKRGREDALELVDRISKSDHLRKLAVNPLILQIIALVHRDRGTLPQRRVELYEECTNVMLEKWDMAKGLDVLLTAREARQVLQPLALWLHGVDGRRSSRMEEIKNAIRDPLEEIGKSGVDPEALLLNIRDRSGIFMGYSEREFGFTHLSFQEYLAAEQIRNKGESQTLLTNFGKKWWREVILLCLALDNPSIIEEFMERLIPTGKFLQEVNLVMDATHDSIRKPSKPFINALHNKKLSINARDNTIRVLREIGGDKVIHALRKVAMGEEKRIALSAFGALESLRAAEGITRPIVEEIFINPADDSEMVLIPAGTFLYGSREDDKMANSDEKPQRVIDLPAFYIDKFPVTNEQFCRFLNDTKPDDKRLGEWIYLQGSFEKERCRIRKNGDSYEVEDGYERHPVIYVTWFGADAYAEWAGKRLPTEQEWEKAARGTDGKIYPWGNDFDKDKCNTYESGIRGTTRVNRYHNGISPYGCYDMAGNVWEWTDSWYYEGKEYRGLRGGSWYDDHEYARCANRFRSYPGDWNDVRGFRCVGTRK
jgi:formylglycine-generating enzyme required for sulfatase activity/predicted phosphodiesterase/energy-coupling factor transporter ATP-binding protein EcfA2